MQSSKAQSDQILKFASGQSISELTKQNAQKIVKDAVANRTAKKDVHPKVVLALDFDNTITGGMLFNRLASNNKINAIKELIGRERIENTREAAQDFIFGAPQPLTKGEFDRFLSAHDQLVDEPGQQAILRANLKTFLKFELYEKGLGMRMPGTLDKAIAETIKGGGMVFIASKSHYTDEIKELLAGRLMDAGYDMSIADSIGIVGSAAGKQSSQYDKTSNHLALIKEEVEGAFKQATGNKKFTLGNLEICLVDDSERNIKSATGAGHSTIMATTPFDGSTANKSKHNDLTLIEADLDEFLAEKPDYRSHTQDNFYNALKNSIEQMEKTKKEETRKELAQGDSSTVSQLETLLSAKGINITKSILKSSAQEASASKPKKQVRFEGAAPSNPERGAMPQVSVEERDPNQEHGTRWNRNNELYALRHLKLDSPSEATGLEDRPAERLLRSIARTFPINGDRTSLKSPFKEVGIGKSITNGFKSIFRGLGIGSSVQKLEVQHELPKRADMMLPLESQYLLTNALEHSPLPKVTVQMPIDRTSQTMKGGEISFSVDFSRISRAIIAAANQQMIAPDESASSSGEDQPMIPADEYNRSSGDLKKASKGLSEFLSKAFVATLPKAMALVGAEKASATNPLETVQTLDGLKELKQFALEQFALNDIAGNAADHPLIKDIDQLINIREGQAIQSNPRNVDLQIQDSVVRMFGGIQEAISAQDKHIKELAEQKDKAISKERHDPTQTQIILKLTSDIADSNAQKSFLLSIANHMNPYSTPLNAVGTQIQDTEQALNAGISFNSSGGTSRVYFNTASEVTSHVGKPMADQQKYMNEVVQLAVTMALSTSHIAAFNALRAVTYKEPVLVEPADILASEMGEIATKKVKAPQLEQWYKEAKFNAEQNAVSAVQGSRQPLKQVFGGSPQQEDIYATVQKKGHSSAIASHSSAHSSQHQAEADAIYQNLPSTSKSSHNDRYKQDDAHIYQNLPSTSKSSHNDRYKQDDAHIYENVPKDLDRKAVQTIKESGRDLKGAGLARGNKGAESSDFAAQSEPPVPTPNTDNGNRKQVKAK